MRSLLVASVALVLQCTPAERAEVTSDLGKDAFCVLGAVVEGGIDDPQLILQRCPKVALGQIEQIAEQWLANATEPDAAPSVSPIQARFVRLRDRARALADGGAP